MKAEEIWQASGKELVSMIEKGLFLNNQRSIRFYAPSFINYKTNYLRSSPAFFPSVSITGSSCALNCKHCNGKVLNTMFPAHSPKELFELCRELKEKGAIGCLISGGCLPDGSVPLDEFVDAISKVKKELGLTIVAHTGVIELSTAEKLKRAGVDAVLLDIIGSDQTIREVYRLEISVEDYDRSLKALQRSGIPFVPHLLVGLHYGKLKGELQALKMISNHSPSAIIMIAFMPIHGTPMEKVNPPNPEDIAKVLVTARLMM
ncbi:MAG: radical SAM protein, partial [Candidatus Heimdallarchaeota archaeon]|nr:radical SAM protein [Candidatus Heimdallarchaeota archaeon]